MPKQTVEALIEGGKATAAPPLGPALGPLGLNIGQVVAKINEVTASFKGMQVPVKIVVDSETKKFDITIGTPPASALIKKEAGIEKGAGNPLQDKVADLRIEQIIKIASMKQTSLLGKTLKEKVKEIIGTCNSMGVLVEGVPAKDALKLVDDGNYDKKIKDKKIELSAEEIKHLEEERKRLAEEMKTRRAEFEAKAKDITTAMAGKSKAEIRAKLHDAKIPEEIIKQFMPAEEKKDAGGKGAAPAAGAKDAKAAAPAAEKKDSPKGKK
jgi:large subunit ribosomal protein L11